MSKKTIKKGIEVRYKPEKTFTGLPYNVFISVNVSKRYAEVVICTRASNFASVSLLQSGMESDEQAVSKEVSDETFYALFSRRDANFCERIEQRGYPRTAFQVVATNPNGSAYSEVITIDWATIFINVDTPVDPPSAPVVTSDAVATATVGEIFIYTITANNTPTSFNATGLPAGVTVNIATGVISGTPTTASVSTITISASNAAGSASLTLILTVNAPVSPPNPAVTPVVTSVATASATVGQPFNYAITANNAPTSFNATGLHASLTVNASTGVISGTPTMTGSSIITISASNAAGTGTLTLTLTVNPSENPPAVIVDPPIVDVEVIFVEPVSDLTTPDGISVAEEVAAIALSLSVSRLSNSPDKINAEITINKTKNFQIENVDKIRLYYRKQGLLAWSIINVNKNKYSAIGDTIVGIRSYSFKVKEASIKRDRIGGFFEFKVEIQDSGFEDLYSETKTLFFEPLKVESSPSETQTFPKAEILDAENPASLRYEIAVKFSEVFLIRKHSDPYYDKFDQFFLDPESVPGLNENLHGITPEWASDAAHAYFPYQLIKSNDLNDLRTRGFFYPASVSEILPCILIKQSNFNQNLQEKSVILFWKINDNFFDYTFFLDRIRVKTELLKVKVQHRDSNGIYQDLTREITLTQEKYYNLKDNKFVLQILLSDVLNSELFGQIDDSYNYLDTLRLLVTKHSVTCTMINSSISSRYRNDFFEFDKLLMPHEWKYICYDQYIARGGSAISAGDNLSLPLDSPYLRGIRLPEKGFQYFDELAGLKEKILQFNLKIFYKLSSSVKSFYTDSIIEGTISSIKLPEIPNDVFIIPPDLRIGGPNLIKLGIGSEAARGVVKLDAYGKISGIELTNLGEGYSLYSTLQDKREQTVSDEVPIVVSANYTLVKDNLNITNQRLNIQNLLFDTKLEASLEHGVRLASIAKDIENSASFSVDQQIKIDEYLRETPLPESSAPNDAIDAYDEVSNNIPLKIESLDSTWIIIQSLYPERSESVSQQLTVYNTDLDPGAETLSDSSLSASAGSVGESNSISSSSFNSTSPQLNSSGGEYSTFTLNGAKPLPAGAAAVEVHQLPTSQQLSGGTTEKAALVGYAALPNMSTRAETFNRLATAINALTSVRMMRPKLLSVESTTRTETWVKPYVEGQEMSNVAQFSKEGKKTDETVRQNSFTQTNQDLTIRNNVEVTRHNTIQFKYNVFQAYLLETAEAVAYDVSEKSTSKFKVKKVSNPFFTNAFSHLGELEIQEGQFLAKEFRQSYKCSSETLPKNENGQSYVIRNGGLWNESHTVSPEANAPVTLQTNTSQITTSKTFETAPLDEVAKYLMIKIGNFRYDGMGEACITHEYVNVSVINPDFYPDIAHL